MKARRVRVAVVSAAVALAGCGTGGALRVPQLSGLPLANGARIDVHTRTCDHGANAYCALELVVSDQAYPNSAALIAGEAKLLARRGWAATQARLGTEREANSPGGRLHVTYATAKQDLEAIDLKWIGRSRAVALALSQAMFDHRATLSLLLAVGAS